MGTRNGQVAKTASWRKVGQDDDRLKGGAWSAKLRAPNKKGDIWIQRRSLKEFLEALSGSLP
jgi:hypothetical protein